MTGEEYESALREIEKLMNGDPPKESEEGRRLLFLASEVELHELKLSIALIHDSDMRAIKMWQEAHPGNDLVWPDRGKMIFWLLEKLEELMATIDTLVVRDFDRERAIKLVTDLRKHHEASGG